MIAQTKAIVLHTVKYSETSVITTLYTEKFGKQAYIINGIRSPKSKSKTGLLQPLTLLDIEAYHHPGREIQRMKEFRIGYVAQHIPTDIHKQNMLIFLSEFLYKILSNEVADEQMFHFIYHSMIYFDQCKEGWANFHIWFLFQFLTFLGIQPENNYSASYQWFDMKNGKFLLTKPMHPSTPDLEYSKLIARLQSITKDTLAQLAITNNQRSKLLDMLLEYYSMHVQYLGNMLSLKILKELYE
jgi:DNA repair protein RecO (recombination protein O)